MIFDQYLRLVNSVNNKAKIKDQHFIGSRPICPILGLQTTPSFWSQFSPEGFRKQNYCHYRESSSLLPFPHSSILSHMFFTIGCIFLLLCEFSTGFFISNLSSRNFSFYICEYVPNCTIHSLSPLIALFELQIYTHKQRKNM